MKKHFPFLLITFLIFTGCKESCDLSEEVIAMKSEVKIERLETELFACQSVEDVLQFLNRPGVVS